MSQHAEGLMSVKDKLPGPSTIDVAGSCVEHPLDGLYLWFSGPFRIAAGSQEPMLEMTS